jgi:hypothetical protein
MLHPIDHLVQAGCGVLDVEMLILPRPAFGGQHSTTVNLFEIIMGKLIPSLKAVLLDEVILFLGGRTVLTPRVSFVECNIALFDEFLSVPKCFFV